jgi:hypothetical protein
MSQFPNNVTKEEQGKSDWKTLSKVKLQRRIDFALACMRSHVESDLACAEEYRQKEAAESDTYIGRCWHQIKREYESSARAYQNAIRLIEDEYLDLPYEEKYGEKESSSELCAKDDQASTPQHERR